MAVEAADQGFRADGRLGLDPARLRAFFHPESVALVGATDRSRWSISTYENWTSYSEGRPIYLVHPHHTTVHGAKVAPTLEAVGEPVDLVYIMVPTDRVLDVMAEAAAVGIRNAVILTAGFAEMGPAGMELQDRVVALAAAHGMVVLGPNGNGFVNAAGRRVPYGLPIAPPLTAGPVGIVLQSGGLASAVVAMAQARGIRPSLVVSMGNEAMVTLTDVLDYLVEDDATQALAVFLETVRQPAHLRQVATRALEAGKPIVALKVGRSQAGTQAALAHTGAVAGDAATTKAALEDVGIVLVESLEDLLATAGLAGSRPGRLGRRLGVVAVSGGACEIIADRATDEGIELPPFPEPTMARLPDVLPPYANPQNPLDVTGYVVVDPTLAVRTLEVVLEHAGTAFDEVLFQTTVPRVAPPDPGPLLSRLRRLAELRRRSDVPIVLQSSSSSDLTGFAADVMSELDLHLLDGIEHGMAALGAMVRWQERRQARLAQLALAPPDPIAVPDGAVGVWGEARTRTLLADHGVPVVPSVLALDADAAVDAAAAMGGPVVVKVASDALVHKSDVGAVALDLRTPDDVRREAGRLCDLAKSVGGGEPGVLVAPMRRGGVELLVSVRRDPVWGALLTVGIGGVWVEIFADAALRILPISAEEVGTMLGELRAAPLLDGARGGPPVDRGALVDAILAIAELGQGLGEALDTLEVNPLWAGPDGCEALDALVVWRDRGAT